MGAPSRLSCSGRVQASALHGAMQSGILAGTFFAPTNEAVAALLDAESISLAAITRNSSLATQARLSCYSDCTVSGVWHVPDSEGCACL